MDICNYTEGSTLIIFRAKNQFIRLRYPKNVQLFLVSHFLFPGAHTFRPVRPSVLQMSANGYQICWTETLACPSTSHLNALHKTNTHSYYLHENEMSLGISQSLRGYAMHSVSEV